jgi:hypothetical protein
MRLRGYDIIVDFVGICIQGWKAIIVKTCMSGYW